MLLFSPSKFSQVQPSSKELGLSEKGLADQPSTRGVKEARKTQKRENKSKIMEQNNLELSIE